MPNEKTPMETLISRLEKKITAEREVLDTPNIYHPNDVKQARLLVSNIETVIYIAQSLLPSERKMVEDAWEAGWRGGPTSSGQYFDNRFGE